MINKQLMNLLKDDKKYIVGIVLSKWLILLANTGMVISMCMLLSQYYTYETITSFGLMFFWWNSY